MRDIEDRIASQILDALGNDPIRSVKEIFAGRDYIDMGLPIDPTGNRRERRAEWSKMMREEKRLLRLRQRKAGR